MLNIVFCRLIPSRKARRSKRENLFLDNSSPFLTKPSAELYGGFVIILFEMYFSSKKSTPKSPYPRSYKSELRTLAPVLSKTFDIAPFPQAHSHISPLNSSFSIKAYVAHAGVGKKSGPSRSAFLFNVGLYPPLIL
ncbi:hypothetical protein AZA_12156 [Nitrospirillum viridazoti Y2]|nr:hypothetical protein AZA_12156 [Nitrospirillum amazonense Y2]